MESNHYETPFTMDDFSYKKCFRKIKHCISLLYRRNLCSAFIGQRLDKSYLFPVSHDVMQRLGMYTTSLDQTNSLTVSKFTSRTCDDSNRNSWLNSNSHHAMAFKYSKKLCKNLRTARQRWRFFKYFKALNRKPALLRYKYSLSLV